MSVVSHICDILEIFTKATCKATHPAQLKPTYTDWETVHSCRVCVLSFLQMWQI